MSLSSLQSSTSAVVYDSSLTCMEKSLEPPQKLRSENHVVTRISVDFLEPCQTHMEILSTILTHAGVGT